MNTLEVVINGQSVDYEDTNRFTLTLSRRLTEITSPSGRDGDRSLTVQLPRTNHNTRVLGQLSDIQGTNELATFPLYDAFVYLNGTQIFAGKFYLNSVTAKYYKGQLKGTNITWIEQLSNRSLRDIQSFKEYLFTGGDSYLANTAALKATDFNNFNHNQQFDFCFPLVSYGNYPFLNGWTPSNRISTQFYYGAVSLDQAYEIEGVNEIFWNLDTNAHLTFEDIPPVIYLVNIVRAMFSDLGYTVSGSFFQNNEVQKLVCPYASDRFPQWNWGLVGQLEVFRLNSTQSIYNKYDYLSPNPNPVTNYYEENDLRYDTIPPSNFTTYVRGGAITQLKYDTYNIDYANRFRVGEQYYIVPEDGNYRIQLTLNIIANIQQFNEMVPVPPPANITLGISVLREGENFFDVGMAGLLDNRYIVNGFDGQQGTNLKYLFDLGTLTGVQNFSAFIQCNRNDRIVIWIGYQYWFNSDAIAEGIAGFWRQQLTVDNTALRIYPDFPLSLSPAANLPDVKQIDFIKALLEMFNLYFVVDDSTKTISFEKRENFFLPNTFAVDLTNRSDIANCEKKTLPGFSRYRYQYDTDENDFLLQPVQDLYNYTYLNDAGQAQLQFVTQAVIFSPTVYRTYEVVETAENPKTTALGNPADTNAVQSPVWITRALLSIPTICDSDHFSMPNNDFTPYSYTFNMRILKLKQVIDYAPVNLFWLRYWNLAQVPNNRDFYQQVNTFVQTVFEDLTAPDPNAQVWSLNWNGTNGLFNLNYKELLQLYLNSFYLEIETALRAVDYSALQLNVPVNIDGNFFTLVKIDEYQPTKTTTTTITLIKRLY